MLLHFQFLCCYKIKFAAAGFVVLLACLRAFVVCTFLFYLLDIFVCLLFCLLSVFCLFAVSLLIVCCCLVCFVCFCSFCLVYYYHYYYFVLMCFVFSFLKIVVPSRRFFSCRAVRLFPLRCCLLSCRVVYSCRAVPCYVFLCHAICCGTMPFASMSYCVVSCFPASCS